MHARTWRKSRAALSSFPRRLVPNCLLFLPPSFSFSGLTCRVEPPFSSRIRNVSILIIVAVNDLLPLKLFERKEISTNNSLIMEFARRRRMEGIEKERFLFQILLSRATNRTVLRTASSRASKPQREDLCVSRRAFFKLD